MSTAIVEERGTVRAIGPTRLEVGCRTVVADSDLGASVAVNGCCLTVVERYEGQLAFDLSEEALRRTSFARLAKGDPVNLERPLTLMARLGGHLVQGHVDGIGEVTSVERDEAGGAWLTVRIPRDLRRYLVEKGSVCVDGVSLTVAAMLGPARTEAHRAYAAREAASDPRQPKLAQIARSGPRRAEPKRNDPHPRSRRARRPAERGGRRPHGHEADWMARDVLKRPLPGRVYRAVLGGRSRAAR